MKRMAAALLMALALPLSSRAELQLVRVLSISNAQQLLVELDGQGRAAVSYTHLTLPTKA